MTSKLRFGVVSESVPGGPEWRDHVRRVEDGGIYLVTSDRARPALTEIIARL